MAGYIRQSSFSDGDTITAALFNDEYNQLLSAFSNTGGHKHDGTTAEGPVIGLIGDAGETAPNNKVLIDTTNNFIEFYVQVSSNPVQQLYIADGAIIPVTDSDVDLGTTSLRFKDTYTDTVTTTGNVSVGGNLTVTGTTTFNGGTITMGDAATDNVVFGADVDSNIIPDDDDTYDLGSASQQWRNIFIDGTANIDSLVADTADINGGTVDGAIIGGSSAAAITGTAITGTSFVIGSADISEAELETIDGVTAGTVAASKAVVVDANKDIGSFRNITLTGELDAGSLDVSGDVDIDGTTNLDVVDIDGAVDMATTLAVAGNVDFNGDLDVDGTTNLDVVDIDGAVDMATTLAVAGNVDFNGDLDVDGTTNLDVVDIDGAVDMATTLTVGGEVTAASLDISGNVDIDGTLETDALSINSTAVTSTAAELNILDGVTASAADINLIDGITNGTVIASKAIVTDANIDITGGRNITITGELDAATLDISGDADIDGTLETDALSINGTAVTSTAAELNILDGVTSTAAELNILDGVTSTAAELNILDGVTSTAAELNILDGVTASAADINLIDGITNGTVIASKAIITDANKDITGGRNITISGELDAATLDISGDADIDGTLEADAITVNGTALASVIAGTTVANATTAAVATTVTITDNESTNENNAIVFTAGGDLDGGNLGLESDGDLKYNPSTGTLSATNISVTGTLSTVDSVTMSANNAVVFEGATADAHETTLTVVDATADRTITLPNVSGTVPVLAAASNTQITSTPEELNALDGITAVVGELNALDIGSTAVGTAVASKAVILDSNKDYTGVRNLTISGELDAATLDISGNVDIDGVLETDNLTIGGAQGSDGQVLTSTGSGVGWEDAGSGAVSAVANGANNRIATFSSGDALNGEANLVFDGSNLGISVASPTVPLDIQSNSSASAVRIRGRSDDIAEVDFYNNANDSVMARFQVDTGYFATQVNGSERIRIDSSGRVGINRTPAVSSTKLEIGGADDTQLLLLEASGHTGGLGIGATGLQFFSNSTVRGKFDQTGEFLVNRADGFGTGGAAAMFVTGRSDAAIYVTGSNSSGYTLMSFLNGGLNGIGSIANSNNNAVVYNTTSDYRLKENVDYTWDATTRLKQLKPARFNWISDEADTTVDGFIAHEVSSIVPEAITGAKDATKTSTNCVLNSEGNLQTAGVTEAEWVAGKAETPPRFESNTSWTASHTQDVYQGIDQSKLVPLLVKTIQELEARITVLEG